MTEQTNNRQSQLSAYLTLATIGTGAFAIATISNTITGAIDSLPPATTAGLVTALPVTLTAMCGFGAIGAIGAAAFIVAWRTPRPAQRQQRDDDERMIVASPRPAQIQQPQIRQLPPPQAQPETIYTAWRGDLAHANERAALSAYRETATYADEYREPELTTPATPAPLPPAKLTVRLGDNGDEITLSRDAWISFVALEKPTRDSWRLQLASTKGAAPNSDYSKCNRIAVAYSALNGRGEWVSAEARQQLTAWVCPTPTPSE
ncbi:MAG: hypothetical protein KGS46_21210 [Chloroflexi bacterium]|nr:hypothetical protein [Chloroflexota bacterium]